MMETRRLSRRVHFLALLAFLAYGAPAASQRPFPMPDTTIRVLRIPERGKPYLCREDTVMSPSLKAHHARAWEFFIGASESTPEYLRPRRINAQFDSAGRPLTLADVVVLVPVRSGYAMMLFNDSPAWGIIRQTEFDSTTVARIESLAAVGRFREVDKVIPAGATRAVTPGEEQRARTLMHWLWDHRCGLHSAHGHQP